MNYHTSRVRCLMVRPHLSESFLCTAAREDESSSMGGTLSSKKVSMQPASWLWHASCSTVSSGSVADCPAPIAATLPCPAAQGKDNQCLKSSLDPEIEVWVPWVPL